MGHGYVHGRHKLCGSDSSKGIQGYYTTSRIPIHETHVIDRGLARNASRPAEHPSLEVARCNPLGTILDTAPKAPGIVFGKYKHKTLLNSGYTAILDGRNFVGKRKCRNVDQHGLFGEMKRIIRVRRKYLVSI